jgi:hypothetical protein
MESKMIRSVLKVLGVVAVVAAVNGVQQSAPSTNRDSMRLDANACLSFGVREARADDAELGHTILKCFHPTGDFVKATFGSAYKDSNGRTTVDGTINFKGGITGKSYYMEVVIHLKKQDGDSYMRVTPGTDTAPLPPSATCKLREWTRVG